MRVVLSGKKNRARERAERKKFDAWAKLRSQRYPGDWVLTGGHDNEEYWAWEGWKGRAEEMDVAPVAQSRVEATLTAADAYAQAVAEGDPVRTATARQVLEAVVRGLPAPKCA